MRGKRSKQYRKLMTQYSQIWGFREPYQCLVDAGMVVDCHNFRYDLIAGLKRTLHGEVKPSTYLLLPLFPSRVRTRIRNAR